MVDPAVSPDLKRSLFEQWDRETKDIVVVFAQGKTGTSTIAAGLKRAGFNPVFQIHTMRPKALLRVESDYLERVTDNYPRHIWEAQWLRSRLPTADAPWKVVTSVRDPIARLVSRFFQQTSRFGGFATARRADELLAELDELCRRDLQRLDRVGWDWFDFDLEVILGQSAYATPFDPEVGYATISTEAVHALILRNESLDRAPKALRAHFGRRVGLASENVGTAKDYGSLYREVRERFRPPVDYVDRVYDTRQVRHFYTEAERAAFREHWTRPVSVPRR